MSAATDVSTESAEEIFQRAYDLYSGRSGEPADKARAVELYQRAAGMGDPRAIYNLCYCYGCGIGIAKDEARAVELYRQAADMMGDASAICNLGFWYQYGIEIAKDEVRAVKFYQRAADMGDARAVYNLGFCYQNGIGIAKDEARAVELIQRAVEMGYDKFANDLATAGCFACGVERSTIEKSLPLLERASQFYPEKLLASWLVAFVKDQLHDVDSFKWISNPKFDYFQPNTLDPIAMIGSGQYGDVYLARPQRFCLWMAVKYVNANIIAEEDGQAAVLHVMKERFTCQVIAANTVSSQAILKYRGFYEETRRGKQEFGLIFEFLGDLSKVEEKANTYLQSKKMSQEDWSKDVPTSLRSFVVFADTDRQKLPIHKITSLLAQVADALNHLHSLGFLHRDLAARNVLFDGKDVVQLADFGIAKFVGSVHNDDLMIGKYQTCHREGRQYAVAWMAPEAIITPGVEEAVFSTASDVYSFGMVLWQCFAHKDPFHRWKDETNADKIVNAILAGERPSLHILDEDTPEAYVALIERCWENDPKRRPTVNDVASELREIVQKLKRSGTQSQSVPPTIRSRKLKEDKWFPPNIYKKMGELSIFEAIPPSLCSMHRASSTTECAATSSAGESTIAAFLSHTAQDSEDLHIVKSTRSHCKATTFVSWLEETLRKEHKIRSFFDATAVQTAYPWRPEISEGVKNCQVFVAILTPAYFLRYWCMQELQRAIENEKKILPVHFGCDPPVKGNIPPHLDPCFKQEFLDFHRKQKIPEETLTKWCDCIVQLESWQGERPLTTGKLEERDLKEQVVASIKRLIAEND